MRSLVAVLILASCLPARAQDVAGAVARCAAIRDGAQRLRCFDAAAAAPAAAAQNPPAADGGYARMDVNDFKLDWARLRGRRVEVPGYVFLSSGDQVFLYAEPFAGTPVTLNVDGLPRDQRRAMLDRCNQPCPAIVRGTPDVVRHVSQGLRAESVEVTKAQP